MVAHHTVKLNEDRLRIDVLAPRLIVPGVVVGIIGLAASVGLGFTQGPDMREHFFYSYLLAFVYFLGLTLGAIFFVVLHHLARAGWSVVLRRLAEGLASNILLLLVLFVPLLFGLKSLYLWVDPATHMAEGKPWDVHKQAYLTPTWFYVRMATYFAIWIFLAFYFKSRSVRQDGTGDVELSRSMEKVSAPAMLLLGYSLTGAAFDLLMSLNANWASTIFGVYIFAGCVLSFLATVTLLALWLRGNGMLAEAISTEHYHDLGKLTFTFTFFWGYIAFSQYMLIWYANMPDETQWFLPRQIGPWMVVSFILLFGHLLIPFAGLLSRHTKRRLGILKFWALWILAAQFIDLFYVIMPNEWVKHIPDLGKNEGGEAFGLNDILASRFDVYHLKPEYQDFMTQHVALPLSPLGLLITLSCFVGIGGLYLAATAFNLKGNALVPVKDPRLTESLSFENI